MKPQDQTILHDPERGLFGNCYAAAIASILELPINGPEMVCFQRNYVMWGFTYLERNLETDWVAYRRAMGVLHQIGVHPAVIEVSILRGHQAPAGYSIVNGPARRGVDHSCVALNGIIVHDPHPSRDGLLAITTYEILVPIPLG